MPFTSYRRWRRNTGRTFHSSFVYGWGGFDPSYTFAYRSEKREKEYEPVGAPSEEVLSVKNVDFCIVDNAKRHHTDEYDIVQGILGSPQLVVRRGQSFSINIECNKPFDHTENDLKLVFETGDNPMISKGTRAEVVMSKSNEKEKWGADLVSKSGNNNIVAISAPPKSVVGKWKLRIAVVKKEGSRECISKYKHPGHFYVLFNPWCKDDSVYFPDKNGTGPDKDLLEEYVLNETGKIYVGSVNNISARPWNFGQFEGNVLDCVLMLLEKGMPVTSRGNPINVSRKLTALVNSPDDSGVLVGNWSGDYSGGTPPTQWCGSVAILEEFYKSMQPVEYGQCWVFSGVLTTVLRTLGIPARSVTNFASAHDSDGSITIDIHFNSAGEVMDDMNCDSVWNFHVWNEAYMARPDLPAGYGGWQVCDATPQETSDGVYCCGPASVIAIRNGEVNFLYDAPFVFAEVNADKVFWVVDEMGGLVRADVKGKAIGKNISTKIPGSRISERLSNMRLNKDPDREDVTLKYKHPEGSEEERSAVLRANQLGSTNPSAYEHGENDVDFQLVESDDCNYGDGFEVVLKVHNKGSEKRTVTGKISSTSMFYTGVPGSLIKSENVDVQLNDGESRELKMPVSFDEYHEKIVQHCMIKFSVLCKVNETKQVYANQEDFRLRKPDLTIKAPSTAKANAKFNVEVSFTNPLSVPLTGCVLLAEGPGIQKPLTLNQPTLGSHQTFHAAFELAPVKAGQRNLVLNFTSKELEGVTGVHPIKITL